MLINGMEFYPELLDAIKHQDFVVFAGAGVSMAPPTHFPSYEGLVKKLLSLKGREIDKKKALDVQMGELQREGVKVNEWVANEFNKKRVRYNSLHKDLLSLFYNAESVKIITTNYDHMFEKAAARMRYNKVPVYVAPALPDPQDFKGIVHLHGDCCDPKHMVVTDVDFGRAYLSNGFATRFVIDLFKGSNVLFIGYSYDDVMMAYLTKAIAVNTRGKVFAITSERTQDWDALGIKPIFYDAPDGKDHSQLYIGMSRLSDHCSRQLVDIEERIASLGSAEPPENEEDNSFLKEICRDDITMKLLLEKVSSEKWLLWFYRNGYLKQLFQTKTDLDNKGKRLAVWIAHYHFDDTFLSILVDNGCSYHPTALNCLFSDLAHAEEKSLEMMVFTMLPFLEDPYTLNLLLATLIKREKEFLSFLLIKQLTMVEYTIKKRLVLYESGNGINCELQRTIPFAFALRERWEEYKKAFNSSEYYMELVDYLTIQFKELYEAAASINDSRICSTFELDSLNSLSIPEQDGMLILCDILTESLHKTQNKRFIKSWISEQLQGTNSLLRKLALSDLRNNECYSPDDRIGALLRLKSLTIPFEKEAIFLLMAENIPHCEKEQQRRIAKRILSMRLNSKNPEMSNYYEKYNIIQWMKLKCPNIDGMTNLLEEEKKILSVYPFFKPRPHPEKDIETEGFTWTAEKDEDKILAILSQTLEKTDSMYDELKSRDGYLWDNQIYEVELAARRNPNWGTRALEECLAIEKLEKYIECIVRGIGYSSDQISIRQALDDLMSYKDIHVIKQELCDLLISFIELQESITEKDIRWVLDYISLLWRQKDSEVYDMKDLFQSALNTVSGKIARALIVLTSKQKTKETVERMKSLLNDNDRFYCTVLFGFLPRLYNWDPTWVEVELLPKLNTNDNVCFEFYWSGITFFSSPIYRELAARIKPYCDNALDRIKKVDSVLYRFMSLYGILIIYISEDPCNDAIRACIDVEYKSRKALLASIKHQMQIMNDETKQKMWKSWLYRFLCLRFSNVPEPLDSKELEEYLEWTLCVSPENFEGLIDLIVSVKDASITSFYYLTDKPQENTNYIRFPHSSIKLFCWLDRMGGSMLFLKNTLVSLRKKWIENGLSKQDMKTLDSLIRKT